MKRSERLWADIAEIEHELGIKNWSCKLSNEFFDILLRSKLYRAIGDNYILVIRDSEQYIALRYNKNKEFTCAVISKNRLDERNISALPIIVSAEELEKSLHKGKFDKYAVQIGQFIVKYATCEESELQRVREEAKEFIKKERD
jgi:hypothetical protein